MFPQKEKENDISMSVSVKIRSVRVTVQNVRALNPEYPNYSDCCSDVQTAVPESSDCHYERLSGVSGHMPGVSGLLCVWASFSCRAAPVNVHSFGFSYGELAVSEGDHIPV